MERPKTAFPLFLVFPLMYPHSYPFPNPCKNHHLMIPIFSFKNTRFPKSPSCPYPVPMYYPSPSKPKEIKKKKRDDKNA